MLTMVIANPMQLTIVSDVPLAAAGALRATNVENKGESAATVSPHTKRKVIRAPGAAANRNSGDTRQHMQDSTSDKLATFIVPKRCEIIPPKTQVTPPDAITRKDNKETLR